MSNNKNNMTFFFKVKITNAFEWHHKCIQNWTPECPVTSLAELKFRCMVLKFVASETSTEYTNIINGQLVSIM